MIGERTLLRSMRVRRARWLVLSLPALALACWGAGRLGSRVAAAATESYRPCPGAGEACRILALGDSLTWGIGYEGGYRVALFELARGDGKNITFTGSLQSGPLLAGGVPFPRHHEGRSGWRIEAVTATVPRPALTTLPHIVLLHVGTNDVYARESPEQMADQLEALLDRLELAAPQALIAVAQIVPLTDPALRDRAAHYNTELSQRVGARRSRGEHLILVDQFSQFPSALLSDGVHPTRAGYERMARAWYAAIAPYLR